MKSINEFATEYAQDKYLPVQTSQAVKAGANYVLEQIEQMIYEKHIEGNLPLFNLTYLVDKLKEK
jgi:hypothetical protein